MSFLVVIAAIAALILYPASPDIPVLLDLGESGRINVKEGAAIAIAVWFVWRHAS